MNNNFPDNWKKLLPGFLGDDFFSSFENLGFETNAFKVNVYESGNEVLCVFAIPGLKIEDVDIYVYQRTIEVRGNVHLDYNGFRLIQEEIPQGSVKRTLELPYPVREDKVDASYQRGMLMIHLHRLIRPNQVKKKVSVKNLDDE
ncbi:Hsp20/alpha crystallin family protein [Anaerobacillus sp. MEB173]|uniref:Hsp20/alpha crystallin family protein n=1 Tax=Anaerobacillus sp. MEB173 TaxID=3383345 RepID=UPI003F90D993